MTGGPPWSAAAVEAGSGWRSWASRPDGWAGGLLGCALLCGVAGPERLGQVGREAVLGRRRGCGLPGWVGPLRRPVGWVGV
jgi:hypothetical protein